MSSDSFLSIDFGTSNSLVGAFHEGRRHEALNVDPHAVDPTMMRTLLYFPHPDNCFYGSEAIAQYVEQDMEGRLFRSFKSHLPNQNYLGTVVGNRILNLETLVGVFLLELKKRAEKILNTTIERAVIGRPARYSMNAVSDSFAIHRMQKASAFAGFKDVQFVPEPLAAAFDYRRGLNHEKIVLIGDFGGGTSDFTLIKLRPDGFSKEDVLAIDGCPLAGDSLDSVFMSQRLNQHFGAKSRYRLPMGSNTFTVPPGIMQRLNNPAHIVHLKERETYEFIREVRRCSLTKADEVAIDRLFLLIEDQQVFPFFESIEQTKRELSQADKTQFVFDYPGLEISEPFAISEFLEWTEDIRTKIFAALDACLQNAGVQAENVDLVCLTGGTSKVPFVKQELEKKFGKHKLQTQAHFHSVLSGLTETARFWSEGQMVV